MLPAQVGCEWRHKTTWRRPTRSANPSERPCGHCRSKDRATHSRIGRWLSQSACGCRPTARKSAAYRTALCDSGAQLVPSARQVWPQLSLMESLRVAKLLPRALGPRPFEVRGSEHRLAAPAQPRKEQTDSAQICDSSTTLPEREI